MNEDMVEAVAQALVPTWWTLRAAQNFPGEVEVNRERVRSQARNAMSLIGTRLAQALAAQNMTDAATLVLKETTDA